MSRLALFTLLEYLDIDSPNIGDVVLNSRYVFLESVFIVEFGSAGVACGLNRLFTMLDVIPVASFRFTIYHGIQTCFSSVLFLLSGSALLTLLEK